MRFFRAHAVCALSVSLLACGEPGGPYETAGIELRSSGGDEVIAEHGQAVGSDSGAGLAAPVSAREDYTQGLAQAKARRESELRQLEPDGPNHVRLQREIEAIDAKLRNVDLAFLQQRNAFVIAERTLNTFVYQYSTDREWEMTYAMRSGDIGLAASIVQDVLGRFNALQPKALGHVDAPDEESILVLEADAPIQDMAADRLRAEVLGANALLKLAQLAVEAAEFTEAERQFRACLSYQSDLGVRSDALNGVAALLELLGRDEEARAMDDIAARTLNLAR